MNKRILSILLAALMLSSSLSLTAFADDAAEPVPDTDVTELAETPEILKKEVLHLALVKSAGSAKDIGLEHVEALAGLLELQVGRSISLPYGVVAKRIYEGVLLRQASEEDTETGIDFCLEISGEELLKQLETGEVCYDVPGGKISFWLMNVQE